MTATADPTVSVSWIRIVALKDLFLHNLLIIHTKQKSKTQRRSWNHKNWFIIGFSRHEIYVPNRKHKKITKKTPLPCFGLPWPSVSIRQIRAAGSAGCVEELLGTCPFHFYYRTCHGRYLLGGVFCYLFLSSPRKLGKILILTNIFSDGLVQPPTSLPGTRWYQHLPFGVPTWWIDKSVRQPY